MHLLPDRYFSPDPAQRQVARQLYEQIAGLPLVCPHGHVDPRLFADPDYTFGSPTELFLIPDHYIFRMLYSQGVPLEDLAIPRRDGGATETDHRRAWQAGERGGELSILPGSLGCCRAVILVLH